MSFANIKKEEVDDMYSPDNFAPDDFELPSGWDLEQWMELTEGIPSREQELISVLAARGGNTRRPGRATGTSSSSLKGPLSTSYRAQLQRERAAKMDNIDKALSAADAADRQAKKHTITRLKKTEDYIQAPEDRKTLMLANAIEKLEEARFRGRQSRVWLEGAITAANNKWNKIDSIVDRRRVDNKFKDTNKASGDGGNNSYEARGAARRVFGSGGVVEALIRKQYEEGMKKMELGSWRDNQERVDWLNFVDNLSVKELALVKADDWQRYEAEPWEGQDSDLELECPKAHTFYGSDECEEEVSGYDGAEESDSEDDEYADTDDDGKSADKENSSEGSEESGGETEA